VKAEMKQTIKITVSG